MKFAGIVYLNKDIVLEIHQIQLEEHGGASGIPGDQPEFYDAMIAIAKRGLDKEGLSNTFREAWITANIPK